MTPGIFLAKEMHTDITLGPVSAYHVWWIIAADGVNGVASNGLIMKGRVIQRGYVMGNYSRFVRPGTYRVSASANPATGVFVTAYRNDSLGRLIVVAINEGTAAATRKFVFEGVTVPTVTPWESSEAVKLTARVSKRPYRGLSLDPQGLSLTMNEPGDFTVAVHAVDGELIGTYAGRGPGKVRVPVRGGSVVCLVRTMVGDGRTFEERVSRRR